jgi:hypothetical protein
MTAASQSRLSAGIREQREWCRKLGSPFYFDLLGRIADDLDASGVCWQFLEPYTDAPGRTLLPLRFLAAIHRCVLEGKLPELAQHFPGDVDAAWTELAAALQTRAVVIRERMPERVQTNEVGRSAALLPGFVEIAQRTGMPLRLLEVGCSAGLNLRWDQILDCRGVHVIDRRGCDLNPLELDENGRLTLLSFVWPDQKHRFEQLARAIEIARQVPAVVEQASALEWLERELANPTKGAVTVVYHSIVMMYLSNEDRARFPEILAEAGIRATAEAPLAWLAMEASSDPGVEQTVVELTMWPGGPSWKSGERRRIATAGFHGQNVKVL